MPRRRSRAYGIVIRRHSLHRPVRSSPVRSGGRDHVHAAPFRRRYNSALGTGSRGTTAQEKAIPVDERCAGTSAARNSDRLPSARWRNAAARLRGTAEQSRCAQRSTIVAAVPAGASAAVSLKPYRSITIRVRLRSRARARTEFREAEDRITLLFQKARRPRLRRNGSRRRTNTAHAALRAAARAARAPRYKSVPDWLVGRDTQIAATSWAPLGRDSSRY